MHSSLGTRMIAGAFTRINTVRKAAMGVLLFKASGATNLT